MWPNPKEPADLVTFTVEIYNKRLHVLRSVGCLLLGMLKIYLHFYQLEPAS